MKAEYRGSGPGAQERNPQPDEDEDQSRVPGGDRAGVVSGAYQAVRCLSSSAVSVKQRAWHTPNLAPLLASLLGDLPELQVIEAMVAVH